MGEEVKGVADVTANMSGMAFRGLRNWPALLRIVGIDPLKSE